MGAIIAEVQSVGNLCWQAVYFAQSTGQNWSVLDRPAPAPPTNGYSTDQSILQSERFCTTTREKLRVIFNIMEQK